MALTKEYASHLEDLFSVLPGSFVRRMFGGAGIFRDGLMYALSLDDGRIALKADEINQPDFRAENMEEWAYPYKGGQKSMGYWYMPERLLDEPEELAQWARAAFEAAMRADAKKPPSQRKFRT
ncbi:MAG: TfoX/Sxy family protein [Nitratireductor sp.]